MKTPPANRQLDMKLCNNSGGFSVRKMKRKTAKYEGYDEQASPVLIVIALILLSCWGAKEIEVNYDRLNAVGLMVLADEPQFVSP